MIKSLTDIIQYEWNYSKRSDIITVALNPEFNSVSINNSKDILGETKVEFNKETIPQLIKMLEEIIK